MTLKLPSQEEQGTTATPTYSSRDEYKTTTTHRKERKPGQSTPYTLHHKISIPLDNKWDKKKYPNYKPQNVILSIKYARLPEVCCGFLHGREARHINTPTEKSINYVVKFQNKDLLRKTITRTKKQKK